MKQQGINGKLFSVALVVLFMFCTCAGGTGCSESIVGSWKEYRADPSDDYGLATWKFNDDSSGMFIVEGYTNVQRVGFVWKMDGTNTIRISFSDGTSTTLDLNNGLLVENSAFGTIVYKKK